jgi:hypothetical protein
MSIATAVLPTAVGPAITISFLFFVAMVYKRITLPLAELL